MKKTILVTTLLITLTITIAIYLQNRSLTYFEEDGQELTEITKFTETENNTIEIEERTPIEIAPEIEEIIETEIEPVAETEKICFGEATVGNPNAPEDYCIDNYGRLYINAYDGASSRIENYQNASELGIDAESFALLGNGYFRDDNFVYYNALTTLSLENNIKILEGIDPYTAASISTHCISDINAVYCDIPYLYPEKNITLKKVEGAEPYSFVLVPNTEYEKFFMDNNNRFENVVEKGIDVRMVESE